MKRNNRVLYEKIMQSVSKEVKKALNEYGDTEAGQRMLARLQHRNVNRKIDQWHKDNPDELLISDEERHRLGLHDVASYAHKQSKGKDYLRRAYADQLDSLMFGDRSSGYKNKNYPHDTDIDVDSLYDDLEDYVKEKQNEGVDIHIVSGFIDGITIIGNSQDIPMNTAFNEIYAICSNYGVMKEAIDKGYSRSNGVRTEWFEIHINVAFYDFDTNDRVKYNKFASGEQKWWDDFCAMMS